MAGNIVRIFLEMKKIDNEVISGVIANKIEYVMGFKQGMGYKLNESDLQDWTISKPDGSEERNLIGKYLDWLPAH